jgi:hypothetical protein
MGMPRYFFHIRERNELDVDVDGLDFPDHATAQLGAEAAAKDMVVDAVIGDGVIDGRQIEVVSATGEVVAVVPLRSVIRF